MARSREKVTVFPQPIGLAATFNPEALHKAAGMIADEGRAIGPSAPRCQLVRFRRMALEPGERRTLTFRLSTRDLAYVDAAGNVATEPGDVTLFTGDVCPSAPEHFTAGRLLRQTVTLVGEPADFDY